MNKQVADKFTQKISERTSCKENETRKERKSEQRSGKEMRKYLEKICLAEKSVLFTHNSLCSSRESTLLFFLLSLTCARTAECFACAWALKLNESRQCFHDKLNEVCCVIRSDLVGESTSSRTGTFNEIGSGEERQLKISVDFDPFFFVSDWASQLRHNLWKLLLEFLIKQEEIKSNSEKYKWELKKISRNSRNSVVCVRCLFRSGVVHILVERKSVLKEDEINLISGKSHRHEEKETPGSENRELWKQKKK